MRSAAERPPTADRRANVFGCHRGLHVSQEGQVSIPSDIGGTEIAVQDVSGELFPAKRSELGRGSFGKLSLTFIGGKRDSERIGPPSFRSMEPSFL